MDMTHHDEGLRHMLRSGIRIAMVGASDKPERDSNRVFRYMRQAGYNVIPVNPVIASVEGVPTVPDLKAAAAQGPLDIVDVFRSPDQVPPVVEEGLAVGAKAFWFQLGVVNQSAILRALDAGADVVVDRCIKIEHHRLF